MSAARELLGSVSCETMMRLERYVALLERWAPRVNLIGRSTIPDLWVRHVADSLQLQSYMPQDSTHAVDIGSGAGFPGLVLAIVTGTHFTLVESDGRKAAFLNEAIRATSAPAEVFNGRFEVGRLLAPLVTARAFAPLRRILAATPAAQREVATYLLLKGASASAEVEEARRGFAFDLDLMPSLTDTRGSILKLRNVRPLRSEATEI